MQIDVALYGRIAAHAGGKHIAQRQISLENGATIKTLLRHFDIHPKEVGLIFINAVLHNLPGLHLAMDDTLRPGDHVGLFAVDYVWPYQYRAGSMMSPQLQAYIAHHGYLRHRPRDET